MRSLAIPVLFALLTALPLSGQSGPQAERTTGFPSSQGPAIDGLVIPAVKVRGDAPEIDGMVIVEDDIPPGEMVPIRINGAMPYDLTGVFDGSLYIDL